MGNPIRQHLGYHRCLLLLFCLFFIFIYPEEVLETLPEKASLTELFWHFLRPTYFFIFLCWVTISDLVANLWRLAEYVFKKASSWNIWPLILDFAIMLVLWWCYRKHVSPLPVEPEEAKEALLFLFKAGSSLS